MYIYIINVNMRIDEGIGLKVRQIYVNIHNPSHIRALKKHVGISNYLKTNRGHMSQTTLNVRKNSFNHVIFIVEIGAWNVKVRL
jgi:carbohydrate-selective porin OprB